MNLLVPFFVVASLASTYAVPLTYRALGLDVAPEGKGTEYYLRGGYTQDLEVSPYYRKGAYNSPTDLALDTRTTARRDDNTLGYRYLDTLSGYASYTYKPLGYTDRALALDMTPEGKGTEYYLRSGYTQDLEVSPYYRKGAYNSPTDLALDTRTTARRDDNTLGYRYLDTRASYYPYAYKLLGYTDRALDLDLTPGAKEAEESLRSGSYPYALKPKTTGGYYPYERMGSGYYPRTVSGGSQNYPLNGNYYDRYVYRRPKRSQPLADYNYQYRTFDLSETPDAKFNTRFSQRYYP